MQPLNLTESIAALSGPRLGSYKAFFAPADDKELYGLYCWNEALAACLATLIRTIEVTMRNAFHRELSLRYGAAAGSVSSDWYNVLDLQRVSREKVQEITHRRGRGGLLSPRVPSPSPDDVVSKLTFGFWKHLPDVSQDIHGNSVDWGAILTALLPNHRKGSAPYWAKQRRQDELFARIDLVGDARNRIAHLEPLWKAGPLLEERRPRPNHPLQVVRPAPATAAEAIDRIKLVHNRAYELLFWLSSHRASDYWRSPASAQFRHLASQDGFDSYRLLTARQRVSLFGMSRLLRNRIPITGMVELTSKGQVIALIVPGVQ